MATCFGKKGIVVRAIKLLTAMTLLSFCFVSYAKVQAQNGFSQAEIAEMKRISEERVNAPAVEDWVAHVGQNTNLTAQKNQILNGPTNLRVTVMILVSSSMPIATLHRYLVDATTIKAAVVLRGLMNNSLQDTGRFIHLALAQSKKIKSGVSIDPVVFEKLPITKVPVIILFNPTGLNCLNTADCTIDPNDYEAVTGNVTLDYALSVMAQKRSANQAAAQSLLRILRKKEAV